MNSKQGEMKNENKENIINKVNLTTKTGSLLKRPSEFIDDNSKVKKVEDTGTNRPESSVIRDKTFTIPNKPDRLIQNRATNNRVAYTRGRGTNITDGNNCVNKAVEVKKRAAWDFKGRLADLEVLLKERTAESNEKISSLETERDHLKDEANLIHNKLSEFCNNNENLTKQNQELLQYVQKLSEDNTKQKEEIESLTTKNIQLSNDNNDLKETNDDINNKLTDCRNELDNTEIKYNQCFKELNELKVINEKNRIDLEQTTEELRTHTNELNIKKNELIELTYKYGDLQKNNENTINDLDKHRKELYEIKENYEKISNSYREKCYENDKIMIEVNTIKNERQNLLSSLDENQKRILETMKELESQVQVNNKNDEKITNLNYKLNELDYYKETLSSDLSKSHNELNYLRNEVQVLRKRLAESDIERRKLYHKYMELRGTIRVCCRIRPKISVETSYNEYLYDFRNDSGLVVSSSTQKETYNGEKTDSNKYEFSFDHVFLPSSTQIEIFNEIEPLVQSALDGYNVCIFAYGQTGSGKTYTMEGDYNNIESIGLIQRSVFKIFQSIDELLSKGWVYKVQVSFLEIYNECIRDLLVQDFTKNLTNKLDIKMIHSSSKSKKPSQVYIPNLTVIDVENKDQVIDLIKIANKNRTVAATKCNEFSSRSHSVFQLKLFANNDILNETCQSTINLVDLAGSERLNISGAEGDRMKETQHINKSLSSLRTVITSLYNKDSHIPFRDSKLTHLLQPALGGNSKTLMFVNISPLQDSFNESINSLRFASTVNKCHIGLATQSRSSRDT